MLTAATAFNDDDILSLEAPGAQVQLVGNLRAVMYMVLPGEEQHFTLRVGSEDFSFVGMAFLAVPATLQQLEKVADLREAKDKAQDSLDAMDESLDVILNTLEGMSGSLGATANGLDQLNSARAQISAGKDPIYDSAELALSDLDDLAQRLGGLDTYSETLSQATTELNQILSGLNDAAQSLAPELATTRTLITRMQKEVEGLSGLLTDVEGYNKKATAIADSLYDTLDELETSTGGLRWDLDRLESALRSTKGVSTLTTSDILGLLPADQAAQMKEVLTLHGQYEDYLKANGLGESQLSFEDFIVAGAYQQFCEKTVKDAVEANAPAQVEAAVQQFALTNGRAPTEEELAAIQAQVVEGITAAAKAALPTLEQFKQAPAAQPYIQQAQAAAQAYAEFSAQTPMVDTINQKIKEINSLVTGLTKPTANVVEELSELCGELGDTGVTDDLAALAGLCRDLLKTMKKHEGEGPALLKDMNEMGDLLSRLTGTADAVLGRVDELTGLVNTYEPQVQGAIGDVQALSTSLQNTIRDTHAALSAAEELLRSVGPALNDGTAQSLSGLSAALRSSTQGLGQTSTIRTAKDTITTLIDDEWDAHSGQADTLLNLDGTATPVSLTDSRNAAPTSVQYVMRTKEIKAEKDEAINAPEQDQAAQTTFWGRVAAMFQGLWEDLKHLLHIG